MPEEVARPGRRSGRRSLRARVDAGEGGEVRGDVLAELRARDRPAALRRLAELVDAVAALEH